MNIENLNQIIEKVKSYECGGGCICGAYGESECGCDVDWRSNEEIAAMAALDYCLYMLKTNHSNQTEIYNIIRDTEEILNAGLKIKD